MSDPKIEPWMFRAAQDVLAEDWDKRLKAICEDRGGGPEFNVRAMILEAAAIIARHAPVLSEVEIERIKEENQRLKAQLASETGCDSCGGRGRRWYSFAGVDTCEKCNGTGKRS